MEAKLTRILSYMCLYVSFNRKTLNAGKLCQLFFVKMVEIWVLSGQTVSKRQLTLARTEGRFASWALAGPVGTNQPLPPPPSHCLKRGSEPKGLGGVGGAVTGERCVSLLDGQ